MTTRLVLRSALVAVSSALLISACGKKKEEASTTVIDVQEAGQQIGDLMASVDESGGSTGSFTQIMKADEKMFARLAPGSVPVKSALQTSLLPEAQAAACSSGTFSSCTGGTLTRTFAGCTVGLATFEGTVTIAFRDDSDSANPTCTLDETGDRVRRTPNYTATGLRGAALSVTKTGTFGQDILRLSATQFSLYNDGIRRVFSVSGSPILDMTTEITEDSNNATMRITGATRASRVLSQGILKVTDNLKGTSCSFAPNAVTWDGSCNCAVSGTWSGTCSDGTSTTAEITGCGTGNVTVSGTTEAVTFDRCY